MDSQAEAICSLLSSYTQSVALLLMPQHTYKRGGLLTHEADVLARFRGKPVTMDRKFALLYDESSRCDPRDSRLLIL